MDYTAQIVCGGGYFLKDDGFFLWLHEEYTDIIQTGRKEEASADRRKQTLVKDCLNDYKFYCFNGEPMYCQVIANRFTKETIDFFDMDWVHQEFARLALPHNPYPFSSNPIPIPITLEQMRKFARILSKGIPFVRIDFYEVNGKMYFGEITFYPASGFGVFEPDGWDQKLGDMIDLTAVSLKG